MLLFSKGGRATTSKVFVIDHHHVHYTHHIHNPHQNLCKLQDEVATVELEPLRSPPLSDYLEKFWVERSQNQQSGKDRKEKQTGVGQG